jgi:hypothetical protein
VIDASTWLGQWPFAIDQQPTFAATRDILHRAGVTHALISPLRAVLAPDPDSCNRDLLREIAGATPDNVQVSIVPVVNPTLAGWRARLNALLDEAGPLAVGVKIVPNYHNYRMDASGLAELASVCQARDLPLCVQLRMQDERSHHPLMLVPAVEIAAVTAFAARHPALKLLICGAYNAELPGFASSPNVHVEMSFVESIDTLPVALKQIDASRLLFATHFPVHDPAPAVAKLSGDSSLAEPISDIAAGNARRLFHL